MDDEVVTRCILKQELKELRQEFDDFAFKLFKYLDARFAAMDSRFQQQDKRIDRTLNALDACAKRVETVEQESLARDAKVDRHERWHQQTARHVGLKLGH